MEIELVKFQPTSVDESVSCVVYLNHEMKTWIKQSLLSVYLISLLLVNIQKNVSVFSEHVNGGYIENLFLLLITCWFQL